MLTPEHARRLAEMVELYGRAPVAEAPTPNSASDGGGTPDPGA
jgi:hypothetical protein